MNRSGAESTEVQEHGHGPRALKEPVIFRVLGVLAWVYLAGLLVFAAVMVVAGERWWVGTILLYLPRLPLLAPLVLLAPLASRPARRRVLAVQAAVAIVVTVALAGPHLTLRAPRADGPSIRVLSYNVWYGRRGLAAVEAQLTEAKPDVILLQAMSSTVDAYLRNALGPGYHFDSNSEFFVASRFPIVEAVPEGRAFVRYTLDTPLGLVDAYDLHAISPRPGLSNVHHQSKRHLLTDGPSDEAAETVQENSDVRDEELATLVRVTAASKNPVLIAGDTNVPDHSVLYRKHLARFQDGFAAVGTGFGYTFPANRLRPWMRIDRILAGPQFRFTSFHVGGRSGSDHCAVWADVTRAPGGG
jgi:endonuclease/exonuclease/phosphatase (EEP) superfamily protein YafD